MAMEILSLELQLKIWREVKRVEAARFSFCWSGKIGLAMRHGLEIHAMVYCRIASALTSALTGRLAVAARLTWRARLAFLRALPGASNNAGRPGGPLVGARA